MARGGTPLGFGPPSIAASNQAQIDDLVQRNRTLEHTNKKLAEQIALDKAKATEATAEVQRQWKLEQVEWRQGCDVLQSCHRVIQLRNVLQLEQERMNILKEQDVTRKEKILRQQRDFKITMFQMREEELEEKIWELEEEREAIAASIEAGESQQDQRIAEYVTQIHAKNHELARSDLDKESLQDAITQLRETCARLQANEEELQSKLERVTLQRDGAVAARNELKNTNAELTRSKAELLRQIEKWESLETKGGAEIEAERKKRVELDIQVRDLQVQLQSAAEEQERLLQKEKRKFEKFRKANQEIQAASEMEIEAVSSQLAKAVQKIEKLRARVLEAERSRPHPPSPPPPVDEDDPVPQPSPSRDPSPKAKPRSRRAQHKTPSTLHTTDASNAEAGPSGTSNEEAEKPVKKRKRKAAEPDVEEVPKPKPKTTPVHNSDIEEVPQNPKSNNKGKRKAVEGSDEGVETAPSNELPKTRRKPQRKGLEEGQANEDVEVVDSAQTQPPRSKSATKAQRNPPSRMGSASTQLKRNGDVSDTEKEPAKKKRRKINIFPPSAEPFSFEAIVS
ncbi:hypothetical protein C0991_010593 [Blastosporella zonata]|nr:hypothetical protein C0991_010593 [Blastosporella zonata]